MKISCLVSCNLSLARQLVRKQGDGDQGSGMDHNAHLWLVASSHQFLLLAAGAPGKVADEDTPADTGTADNDGHYFMRSEDV